MADLSELQASQSIKIAGANSSGSETNYVDASTLGLYVDGSNVNQPVKLSEQLTYVVNSGPLTGATATGTKSLLYLFHSSSITKKYRIISVIVDQTAGNGSSGSQRIELRRITAENGTPGGTSLTVSSKNSGDTESSAVVRSLVTGAPTRETPVLFSVNMDPKSNGYVMPIGFNSIEGIQVKPWTISESTSFGYEIVQQVSTTLSTAPTFNITIEWTEE
jgi:hypothetical protein